MAVDLQRRSDVRLLLIAVQGDTIVPPSQSCLLANAIGAENHLMLANGEYSPSTVPPGVIDGCGSLTLSGAPVNWNTRAVFLLYSNRSSTDGHFSFGDATPPPPGQAWDLPRDKGIRDFLQISFPE